MWRCTWIRRLSLDSRPDSVTAVGVDRGQRTHDTASRNVNHVRLACGGEELEMLQAATDCDSMASEGGLYKLAPWCGGVAHF